jgi:hypothetical protein
MAVCRKLVLPVEDFPANGKQCLNWLSHPRGQAQKDFSDLNYPDESFKDSIKYLQFDDLVKQMAQDLIQRLKIIPPWRKGFPVVEPQPLPARSVGRQVV